METRDVRPAISDLPLDLFGEVDTPALEPEPVLPEESHPDTHCWVCGSRLTEGLSTCVHCGAQNELTPVLTSSPASGWPEDAAPQRSGSYASRLVFAFMYMTRDIIQGTIRFLGMALHDFLDWSVFGHRSRNRED